MRTCWLGRLARRRFRAGVLLGPAFLGAAPGRLARLGHLSRLAARTHSKSRESVSSARVPAIGGAAFFRSFFARGRAGGGPLRRPALRAPLGVTLVAAADRRARSGLRTGRQRGRALVGSRHVAEMATGGLACRCCHRPAPAGSCGGGRGWGVRSTGASSDENILRIVGDLLRWSEKSVRACAFGCFSMLKTLEYLEMTNIY